MGEVVGWNEGGLSAAIPTVCAPSPTDPSRILPFFSVSTEALLILLWRMGCDAEAFGGLRDEGMCHKARFL